jgi:hypothetical protein
MPPKPNYRHQRSERARSKQQKKQEKLQRLEEGSAARKLRDEPQALEQTPDETPPEA